MAKCVIDSTKVYFFKRFRGIQSYGSLRSYVLSMTQFFIAAAFFAFNSAINYKKIFPYLTLSHNDQLFPSISLYFYPYLKHRCQARHLSAKQTTERPQNQWNRFAISIYLLYICHKVDLQEFPTPFLYHPKALFHYISQLPEPRTHPGF